MKALVFESAFGGHQLQWAGTLAQALARAGVETTLVLNERAPTSKTFEHHVLPLSGTVRTSTSIRAYSPNQSGLHRHRAKELTRLVREHEPDRIYLPTADGLAQTIAALTRLGRDPLAGRPTEALLMNGAVAHDSSSFLHRARARLSYGLARSGPWARFFHLNPFVQEWEKRHRRPRSGLICSMPEPVEAPPNLARDEARRRLGLDPGGRYLGMAGKLDGRKGADTAILAFARAHLGARDRLLLVGSVAPETRAALDRVRGTDAFKRIEIRDEVVDDETLLVVLSALDLVFLPYRWTAGSSGIITRSSAVGRPVLTTGGGWAEDMNSLFSIGWIHSNEANVDDIARTLGVALDEAVDWRPSEALQRFVAYNTIENFSAHWVQGAYEARGVVPPRPASSWDHLTARIQGIS